MPPSKSVFVYDAFVGLASAACGATIGTETTAPCVNTGASAGAGTTPASSGSSAASSTTISVGGAAGSGGAAGGFGGATASSTSQSASSTASISSTGGVPTTSIGAGAVGGQVGASGESGGGGAGGASDSGAGGAPRDGGAGGSSGTCRDPAIDCPPPGSDCLLAYCDANRSCGVRNAGVDAVCSSGFCTSDAQCVQCVSHADCPVPEICDAANHCVPPPCDDDPNFRLAEAGYWASDCLLVNEAPAYLQAIAQHVLDLQYNTGILCASSNAVPYSVPYGEMYQPSQRIDFDRGDSTIGWLCLGFTIEVPIHGSYLYTAGGPYVGPPLGGPGPGPDGFEVSAKGDWNGNGIVSTFTIAGTPNEYGYLLSPIFENQPLE